MQKTRAVASARAFLGYTGFDILVDIAGLEPVEDWHLWQDVEGNTLRIHKTKAVKVYPAKIEAQSTLDIFRKAKPSSIAKHSYWVLCLFGNTQSVLCFLGYDGKLRCCQFQGFEWIENFPAVLLGYKVLQSIVAGYIETDTRKVSAPKIEYPKGLEIEEAWESGYPSSDTKVQDVLYKYLKGHINEQSK